MEWGCPVTRRGSNDAQLEHVVKFLTGNLESLRCESTHLSCDWGSCGGYIMVGDGMFDGFAHVAGLCYGRKLVQDGFTRASWFPR